MKYRATVRFSIIFAFLVCLAVSICPQAVETFQVNFTRTVKENKGEYITRGTLYYKAPDKVFIHVTTPVGQWSVFDARETTIYYPDSRKAFIFKNSGGNVIPFTQSFLGLVKDDFGLSDAGFKILGQDWRGGNLFTFWKPPNGFEKSFGRVTLGVEENKPFFLEAVDTRNNLIFRIVYSGFKAVGGGVFPSRVHLIQREQGKEISEEIDYGDFKAGENLPAAVEHFSLPPDVILKEMTW
ncbi:MAG: outer membrane lipoprotein carrier protein LolA [Spirochaetota bacterium]